VRHVAEIQGADIVVINRRRKRDSVETHANEIVLESPCPVLCLPTKVMAASINIVRQTCLQEQYFVAAGCC
jgi:hypothetical protein